jgi:hypothetical protein
VGSCALGAGNCRVLLRSSFPGVIWCLRFECRHPVLHSAPGAIRSGGAAFCSGSSVGNHALGADACCVLHHAVLVYFILLRHVPSGASAAFVSLI